MDHEEEKARESVRDAEVETRHLEFVLASKRAQANQLVVLRNTHDLSLRKLASDLEQINEIKRHDLNHRIHGAL